MIEKKKKEYSAILELCKFQNPNKDAIERMLATPLDYPFILGQLLYNRMGAVAYYTLKKCGLIGHINREFCNTLRVVYKSNYKRAESYMHAVEMVSRILAEADFPYALLKGAYLIFLYPRGLRSSNDIDILVEPKDISRLEKLLKQNGFTQGYLRNGGFLPATRTEIISTRMNRGETVPFIKKLDMPGLTYCEIDINFSLEAVAHQKNDIVSKMLKERQKPEIETGHTLISQCALKDLALRAVVAHLDAGCPLGYTLSRTDFFIHLCMHLYKEATVINWVRMGRDLSLYKFCDLFFLIEQWMSPDFYSTLKNKICQYGLQKECYFALYHMQQLFSCEKEQLEMLLDEIKPSNIRYLKEIEDIAGAKKYSYEMEFMDWFFCSNREAHLRGAADPDI